MRDARPFSLRCAEDETAHLYITKEKSTSSNIVADWSNVNGGEQDKARKTHLEARVPTGSHR